MIAEDGLPKPVFNAFRLLHRLGDQRIDVDSASAIATRRTRGGLAIAMWNLVLPEEEGEPEEVTVILKGMKGKHQAMVSRVDATHGSVSAAYNAMGKPVHPTQAQIVELRRSAKLPPAEKVRIRNGQIQLTLPPRGLALIELP